MFDSLKEEVKKRKSENKELKAAIEREKDRLGKKRENAKKGILRKKIAVIDNFSTAKEQKRDERIIEQFEEKQKEAIEKQRKIRRDEMIKANSRKIVITAVALISCIAIGSVVGYSIYNRYIANRYNKAVSLIVGERYNEAKKELKGLKYGDSSALLSYVNLQISLDEYTGKAETLLDKMNKIGEIKETKVKQQYNNTIEQLNKALSSQKEINEINVATINLDSKSILDQISQKLEGIDDRYRSLVNTEKLEFAKVIVENIEKETPAGKTIVAIFSIGEVSLNSKPQIDAAKELYNSLSDEEKKLIANYSVLRTAEGKYYSLIDAKNKKAEEELAKQEEARKAEEERKQAEEEKKRAEEAEKQAEEERKQANLKMTVYLTPTGTRYHFDKGCRYVTSVSRELTQEEAIREGLTHCTECGYSALLP